MANQRKLTDDDITRILFLYDNFISQTALAKDFKVCQTTISNIIRYKGRPPSTSRGSKTRGKLSLRDIGDIRIEWTKGRTQQSLAEQWGVTLGTINRVIHYGYQCDKVTRKCLQCF